MAQPALPDSVLLNSPVYRERFLLFTDRDMYAVNERILFRVINTSEKELQQTGWSRVLYLELVNNHNTPVRQAKYPLDPEGASGYLEIPDSLTTGSYCLRAYTKWMRNFHPSGYAHTPVAIVNPEKPVVMLNTGAPSTDTTVLPANIQLTNGKIRLRTDKDHYGTREKVSLAISMENGEQVSSRACCLTVVKKGTLQNGRHSATTLSERSIPVCDTIRYMPETRGLSITGEMHSAADGAPAPNTEAHMTLLGSVAEIFGFRSDPAGRIDVALPEHSGSQDILIVVNHDDPLEIKMDEEFSGNFLRPEEYPHQDISGRESQLEEIMINTQIKRVFETAILNNQTGIRDTVEPVPFYGHPAQRWRMEEYIRLPTLQEFFFELVMDLTLRRSGDEVYYTMKSLSFMRPLVLLDNVAVYDVASILNIPPGRIDYVDIVNEVYLHGDFYYGGIISIVTLDGDRCGVALPGNSSYFGFQSFEPQQADLFPLHSTGNGDERQAGNQYERIPDLRNTLFWIPDLVLPATGATEFEFSTSDNAGEYVIVVRGITADGEPFSAGYEFLVE